MAPKSFAEDRLQALVVALIKTHDVDLVDLRFTDLRGLWQHFSITLPEVGPGLFEDGRCAPARRELVSEALRRGHDVSAFVRAPGKLTVIDARLRAVQEDIQRADSIQAATRPLSR